MQSIVVGWKSKIWGITCTGLVVTIEKSNPMHEAGEGYSHARVQRQRPGAKTNLLLVCASTNHQRQATRRQYKYGQLLRSFQVRAIAHMMKRNQRCKKSEFKFCWAQFWWHSYPPLWQFFPLLVLVIRHHYFVHFPHELWSSCFYAVLCTFELCKDVCECSKT